MKVHVASLLLVVAMMVRVSATLAQTDGAPVPVDVDAAREGERYVIAPGAEVLLSEMLGRGQALPGGCTFTNGRIERSLVDATYTCGTEQVGLQLLHPEAAPPGSVRTKTFAIAVSGTPPGEIVEAITERVRAREAEFEWTFVGGPDTQTSRWRVAAIATVAVLTVAALYLLAARKRRTRRGRPAP